MRTQGEDVSTPQGEASGGTSPADPWILDIQPPDWETIAICCEVPVCMPGLWYLLQPPARMKTGVNSGKRQTKRAEGPKEPNSLLNKQKEPEVAVSYTI